MAGNKNKIYIVGGAGLALCLTLSGGGVFFLLLGMRDKTKAARETPNATAGVGSMAAGGSLIGLGVVCLAITIATALRLKKKLA